MCTSTFSRFNSDPGNQRCTLVATEPSGFTHRASPTELHPPSSIFVILQFIRVHLKFTVYGRKQASKQAYTRTCAMQSRQCGACSGSPQKARLNFNNWGERERAPHQCVQLQFFMMMMMMVCRTSFRKSRWHSFNPKQCARRTEYLCRQNIEKNVVKVRSYSNSS